MAYSRANEINKQIDFNSAENRNKRYEEDQINVTRTKVADLVRKVEKSHALHKNGLLSDEEYRSKISNLIDELSEKKPYENSEDFLMGLIPQVSSGALNAEDVSKIKAFL